MNRPETDIITAHQPIITIGKLECLSCKHWIMIDDPSIKEYDCLDSGNCIASKKLDYVNPIICISERKDFILERLVASFKQDNVDEYADIIREVSNLPPDLQDHIFAEFKKEIT